MDNNLHLNKLDEEEKDAKLNLRISSGDLINLKRKAAYKRCAWVSNNPLYIAYHDHEWAVPVYDDRLLFEFLILEGMQAGLSWLTVLKKRDNFRQSFDYFDAQKIARYSPAKIERLMQNEGIIRHRLKIQATISNAKAFLALQKEKGSFSDYLWSFVDNTPIIGHWKKNDDVPTHTPISDALSKDLKKRGFRFVGSTICYAFMQAVGMVNDHTQDCSFNAVNFTRHTHE